MYRRKRKKRKIILLFFFIFFLVFLLGASYVYFQYQAGLEKSANDSVILDQKVEFNGADPNKGITNVLLLGTDARGKEISRTDTIMVAQYNSDNNEVKILSIMRDSYVNIPGHGSQKINAAYAIGGPELLRKTLKENFDIDIQYYSLVDFKGFSSIIDEVFPDGVEVDIEKEMVKGINPPLHPGMQKLDGDQLLSYVRFRKDSESDFGRVRRQQEVLKLLTDEMTDLNGVMKIPKTLGIIKPFIRTNIKTPQVLSIATSVLGDNKSIESMRIPLDHTYTDEYYDGVGLVLDLDVSENKKAIKDFLSE
ncbi:LCP family protein [Bacillus sp. MCCB 382]|uniref:LCP family protein n=1 Tax=Bacillus sp. MCCB 382 TaxID=2860197 RepID=UPI001C579291|nr:LCP family protein [Bacillus sp. MCCB 382]